MAAMEPSMTRCAAAFALLWSGYGGSIPAHALVTCVTPNIDIARPVTPQAMLWLFTHQGQENTQGDASFCSAVTAPRFTIVPGSRG